MEDHQAFSVHALKKYIRTNRVTFTENNIGEMM